MKLSQWHDGSVKPVHVGVYESDSYKCEFSVWYRLWDGNYWHNGRSSVNNAAKNETISNFQDWSWRGIVKDKK